MSETLRYVAPAKINLGLRVLGRRADGYHELDTVFYRVLEPHDSVEVRESEMFRFTCSDPNLVVDERNLMMRAAHLYSRRSGLPLPPIHVHLDKRIPMGAGLGGGSSDAAAMLQILRDYYDSHSNIRHPIRPSNPIKPSSDIGADVPFFVSEVKAAHATGIGEILTPIELDLGCTILIVVDPAIHVSTREAYEGLGILGPAENTKANERIDVSNIPLRKMREHLRNDFEPSVFAKWPALARMKQSVYDRGAAFALMSGSGSAIYGLFEELEDASKAKAEFERDGQLAYLS